MRLLIIAVLCLTACTVRPQAESNDQIDPAPQPATESPVDDDAPSVAAYEDALAYFVDYCYSDCTQVDEAQWQYHLDRADPTDLRYVMVGLATLTYSEVDDLCWYFWDETDASISAQFDGFDRDAVLASFYYVCDT